LADRKGQYIRRNFYEQTANGLLIAGETHFACWANY